MSKPATGSVEWVPPKRGEKQGHYKARVTCIDGSRPWIHFEPGPCSKQAEARAQERASAASEQMRSEGIVGVPQRLTEHPVRLRLPSGGETVADYSDRWLAFREKRGIMSIKIERARVRLYVVPILGHVPMRDVSRADLEKLVVSLDERVGRGELSWKTAIHIWALTRRMFRDACRSKVEKLRVRDDDPAAVVEGPDRGARKQKCYLWPNEFLEFVCCEDIPLVWRRRVALAVYLLPRASELKALRWNDVDLERGVIHFHRAADWLNGGEKPTKTGIARRFSIEPNVLPLLEAMRDEEFDGEARVIDMPDDTNLARGFRFYLERAGVTRAELHTKSDDPTRKPISFHDLRATGITWMAVRGDEPLRIQQRAGHTDFQTTQIYIREAEAVRDGFGEVFPALPECLLTKEKAPNRLANRPRNRPKAMQRRVMTAEREGFEPSVGF